MNDALYKHILHSLNKDDNGEEWKLSMPTKKRKGILRQNHDAPTAGHAGLNKTISRLARYWSGMYRDAAKYVRVCPICLQYKSAQQRSGSCTLRRRTIAADFVGPLPRSGKGHAWLLAIQDKFTKWAEIRPLQRATATTATKKIYEVSLRHGAPDTTITDSDRQFISHEFRTILHDTGAK